MTMDTTQNEVFNSFVHITDDAGIHHTFGPGDPIPDWARPVVGDHVIAGPLDISGWREIGYTTDPDPLDGTVFQKPQMPDVAAQARGYTTFADQDDYAEVPAPTPPPTSGPGSNRPAWVEFAGKVGQPVTTAMSRQDIIDALVRNGHITD